MLDLPTRDRCHHLSQGVVRAAELISAQPEHGRIYRYYPSPSHATPGRTNAEATHAPVMSPGANEAGLSFSDCARRSVIGALTGTRSRKVPRLWSSAM